MVVIQEETQRAEKLMVLLGGLRPNSELRKTAGDSCQLF
jgi:hypothetical protein